MRHLGTNLRTVNKYHAKQIRNKETTFNKDFDKRIEIKFVTLRTISEGNKGNL